MWLRVESKLTCCPALLKLRDGDWIGTLARSVGGTDVGLWSQENDDGDDCSLFIATGLTEVQAEALIERIWEELLKGSSGFDVMGWCAARAADAAEAG